MYTTRAALSRNYVPFAKHGQNANELAGGECDRVFGIVKNPILHVEPFAGIDDLARRIRGEHGDRSRLGEWCQRSSDFHFIHRIGLPKSDNGATGPIVREWLAGGGKEVVRYRFRRGDVSAPPASSRETVHSDRVDDSADSLGSVFVDDGDDPSSAR